MYFKARYFGDYQIAEEILEFNFMEETPESEWPGRNLLGKILTEINKEINNETN